MASSTNYRGFHIRIDENETNPYWVGYDINEENSSLSAAKAAIDDYINDRAEGAGKEKYYELKFS